MNLSLTEWFSRAAHFCGAQLCHHIQRACETQRASFDASSQFMFVPL